MKTFEDGSIRNTETRPRAEDEAKLKAFDRDLFLDFCVKKKVWSVCEDRENYPYYRFLFWLEDRQGHPKEFGDWVINKLFVSQQNMGNSGHDTKKWLEQQRNKIVEEAVKNMNKHSEENAYAISHDIILARKAIAEIQNESPSDVTAGYRKLNKG